MELIKTNLFFVAWTWWQRFYNSPCTYKSFIEKNSLHSYYLNGRKFGGNLIW